VSNPDVDLAQVYEKYRRLVESRVRRVIGHSPEDAEDVVSRVFLSVIELVRSGKFRGDADIGTIVFTITERRVADHLRKRYAFKDTPHWPIWAEDLAVYDIHEEEFEQRQMVESVVSAMDCLTPRQREVFTLCGLKDRTAAQAGARMGLSKDSVKVMLCLAKKRLREKLGEIEPW
jgi:RNA polymerase sigma factor (sigma-70 family)